MTCDVTLDTAFSFSSTSKQSPVPAGHNSRMTGKLVVCPLVMPKAAGNRGPDSGLNKQGVFLVCSFSYHNKCRGLQLILQLSDLRTSVPDIPLVFLMFLLKDAT